jgi:leucyl aminopeptidase
LGKLNAARKLKASASSQFTYASSVTPKQSVKALMENLDDKHLRADIAKLTSFWNRSYKSPYGLASSEWLYSHVESVGFLRFSFHFMLIRHILF